MTELLSRIESDKKVRIINSAFEEFATNGYEKASTNEIVFKAGISKGLLFHYFGNKEKLYDTLCEFAFEYVISILESGMYMDETDIFLRIQQVTSLKLKAMEEYPHIYDFLRKVLDGSSEDEIKSHFSERTASLIERAYTENIDYSLFKPEVDLSKALEIIHWTIDGVTQKMLLNGDVTLQEIIEENQKYMDMLRKLFYV